MNVAETATRGHEESLTVTRKLFRNFVLLFGGSALGQFAFFLGLVHLAKVLGPGGFGSWNFAQTWLLYLFRGAELGIELLAIREVSKFPGLTTEWMKKSYQLRITIACVLYVLTIILVLLGLFPPYASGLLVVFSLGVLIWSFTLEWVLEARQDVVWVSTMRVMKGVLFAGPVFLFVQSESDSLLSAWIYLASLFVSVGVIAIVVLKRSGWNRKWFTPHELFEVLSAGIPVGAAALLSHYSMFLGMLVVGYMHDESSLGYFAVSHRLIVFVWVYVIVSSNRVILPTLALYYQNSRSDFKNFMRKFLRLITMVAMPAGLVGTLFSPYLLPWLFGGAYASSVLVFQVLLWGLMIAIVRSVFDVGMIASEDQRLFLRVSLFQAITYSVTTVVLTSLYGIVGAAAACVVSEGATLLYVLLKYQHARLAAKVQDVWKPVVSLGAGALVAFALRSYPLGGAVASVMTYVLIFSLTKGFTTGDMRILKNMLSARPPAPQSGNHLDSLG